MQYKVIKSNDTLNIIDEEGFPLYRLSSDTLQESSIIEGSNCPECILQLASSYTLPTYVLYKIAFYIQKNYPYLHFNWFTTFFYVEKRSYLRTAFDIKDRLENGFAQDDEQDKMDRFVEFEENEPVDNINIVILKIVMMNIINFNVMIRWAFPPSFFSQLILQYFPLGRNCLFIFAY